jgi:hypothetical protein
VAGPIQSIYHPDLGRQVNYSVQSVPEDAAGQAAAVIGIMTDYALQDAASPEIIQDLQTISSHPQRDYTDVSPEEARQLIWIDSVWWHVRTRIRKFVSDEQSAAPIQPQYGDQPIVETLIRPRDMALYCSQGNCQGDCDDYAMYVACLLVALGIRCSFVTVAADASDADWFSHVYVAAYTPAGTRVALDASHGSYPGWEVANYWKQEEWPVTARARFLPYIVAAALVVWIWHQVKQLFSSHEDSFERRED